MRVLIDQQFHPGHHYQYLAKLLPMLVTVVDDVVVAVTKDGLASAEFQAFLAPLAHSVRFEPILPYANPGVPLGERWRVHRDLREAVRRIKPDYVLIPSGDAQWTAMPLFRFAGLAAIPGRIPCEVGIHFGFGSVGPRMKDRLRDVFNRVNLSATGLRRIHVVNHLYFERLRKLGWGENLTLMPHPVAANPRPSKEASRRRLDLPVEGQYIGLAASIDSRKAVAEFLAAFRAANVPKARLLLAGWMNNTHQRTIEEGYGDLLREGRLVLRKGFLEPDVFQTVLTALDVVCTPYPRFEGLSSTLLEGVAAGRPVLTDAFGWSETMVRRFGLGASCDVLNHAAFTRAIRTALEQSGEYRESEAVRRLLAFHTPENFALGWIQGIRKTLGQPADPVRSWDWVCEAAVAQ